MKFINKNKNAIIAVGVFAVVLVLFVVIKNTFFPDERQAIYGTRLEGIEKFKISDDIEDKVKSSLDEYVKDVSIRTAGRIVNIILTVNSDVSVDTAKGYATKVLESFEDDEKKYYDFQIFVKKEVESNEFPIVGYKHHNKDSFSWTKDRMGS